MYGILHWEDLGNHRCQVEIIGRREVVADRRDLSLSHVSDDLLQVFQLLGLPRAVQQDIVPLRGIEIFDGRKRQAVLGNTLIQGGQRRYRPVIIRAAGGSPRLLLKVWLARPSSPERKSATG